MRKSLGARVRDDRTMLLLMLPGLAYFLVFFYVPILGNVIAFQDYQPFLGFGQSAFVGLDNFASMVADPDFWNAVKNTLIISFFQLVLYFPAPIALALLLNSLISQRVRKFIQSVVYLPHFISWVLVVALFQKMLGGDGMLNGFLLDHGASALNITGNPDLFKLLVTAQVIWKDTGWGTIIFLAAIASIDVALYEAAAVDGAGRWRRMWHVTLPGIKSVIVLLLILRLGDVLTVGFEQILLQRDAVGQGAAEVLDTYVYYHGLVHGDWGTSAAAGLVKGIVGAALIYLANRAAHALGEQGVYQR